MNELVSIIGTSHLYQFGGAARSEMQNRAFADLVRKTSICHGIRCLAEEMSNDALVAQNRTQSTVREIAQELGLAHLYCDPTENEQSAMELYIERRAAALKHLQNWSDERILEGIAGEHRKREGFWLGRLQEKNVWPCLFICGTEHAIHFSSLLRASGLRVQLVVEAWDA
jgi:hypothetical protein